MSDFREQWNDTCKAAGLKPISTDTAARIMAIVYEFDREDITHCPKLLTDLKYIQDEYGIDGGKIPHSDFQKLFAKYAKEIENNDCEPTEWAKKLMKDKLQHKSLTYDSDYIFNNLRIYKLLHLAYYKRDF